MSCSISTSRMSFSNDAVRPPSCQPAAWYTRLPCPMTAPHSDISVSYAPWASAALDALAFEVRYGSR